LHGRYYQPGKNFAPIPNVQVAPYKKLHSRGQYGHLRRFGVDRRQSGLTSPAVSPFAVSTAYDVVMHPGGFTNPAAV
jgi:hypothetical protein